MKESMLLDYVPYVLVFFATYSFPLWLLKMPVATRILWGLNAYVVPPSDLEPEKVPENALLSNRNRKKKEKAAVELAGFTIYSVPFGASNLEDMPFYPQWDQVVLYSALAFVTFTISQAFRIAWPANSAQLVPTILCLFAVSASSRLLLHTQFERSQPYRPEHLSMAIMGLVGFLTSLTLLMLVPPSLVDFGIDEAVREGNQVLTAYVNRKGLKGTFEIPGYLLKFVLCLQAGILSGIIFPGVLRSSRCLFEASVAGCWRPEILKLTTLSLLARTRLKLAMAVPLITTALWVKPLTSVFVARPMCASPCAGGAPRGLDGTCPSFLTWEPPSSPSMLDAFLRQVSVVLHRPVGDWTEGLGLSEATFRAVQHVCLAVSGLMLVSSVRILTQVHLNTGLLRWYTHIHKAPEPQELDPVRARLKTVNILICKVALQCATPGFLALLLVGVGQMGFGGLGAHKSFIAPQLLRSVCVFLSWVCIAAWSLPAFCIITLLKVGFFQVT